MEETEGVFEIQDFTIATDWENFIAEAEQSLRSWGIVPSFRNMSIPGVNNKTSNSSYCIKKETITFDDYHGNFSLGLYQWKPEQHEQNNEKSLSRTWEEDCYEYALPPYLQTNIKLLSQPNLFKFIHWFNCKEFLLLQPCSSSFGSATLSQSQSHLLLSSIVTALNNCQRSDIPVFVPVREQWRDEYIGYCQHSHLFNFGGESEETIGINRKQKNKFSIISRLSYFRRAGDIHSLVGDLETEETIGVYEQAPQDELLFVQQYNNMFYGPSQDPIRILRLISSWEQEGSTQNFDQLTRQVLDPMQADNWTLRLRKETDLYLYMTSSFRSFLTNFTEAENMTSIHSTTTSRQESNRKLPLLTAMSLGLKLLKSPRFPSTKEIDGILAALFHYKKEDIQVKPEYIVLATDNSFAPSSCIISLLATFMVNLDGIAAVCMLWKEFVKEIRWHWEQTPPKQIPLVDTPVDSIDMRRCLIYQKLQMINYCVKLAEQDHLLEETKKTNSFAKDGWEISFAVSDEDHSLLGLSDGNISTRYGADKMLEPSTKLLKFIDDENASDCFIYIPFTQTVGLVSEDMIEEQQHALENQENQGDSQHHQQLKSDMESFKAANPECVFADFVRWYSPADWLEENSADQAREDATMESHGITKEQTEGDIIGANGIQDKFPGHGSLSARMRAPSNTWRNIWLESESLPISAQKPLFNFKREGEKAIHYLETITPLDLMQQISGIAVREAFNTLSCSPSLQVKFVHETVKDCAVRVQQAFLSHVGTTEETEIVLEAITSAECVVSQADSLLTKFNNQYELVDGLLSNGQQSITTEMARLEVENHFCGLDGFGPAEEEEFVFQAQLRLPGSPLHAHPTLQRLFANITGNEYRIATAFAGVQ